MGNASSKGVAAAPGHWSHFIRMLMLWTRQVEVSPLLVGLAAASELWSPGVHTPPAPGPNEIGKNESWEQNMLQAHYANT